MRRLLRNRRCRISTLPIAILLVGGLLRTAAFAEEGAELKVGLNELWFKDGQYYCLYVPEEVLENPRGAKILVSIHDRPGEGETGKGSRPARAAAERFAPLANKMGWVVLAPNFDEERFGSQYQQLNFGGLRADARLDRLVSETRSLLRGVKTNRLLLFGFSSGGEFVHRYAMFHPGRVDKAVVAASGWYTWPDPSLTYPVGTSPEGLPMGVEPEICELCGLDLLVLVGEKDVSADALAEEYEEYNLLDLQGDGRVERAENWVETMRGYAAENDCDFSIELKIVPRAGHIFIPRIRGHAAKFLSGK